MNQELYKKYSVFDSWNKYMIRITDGQDLFYDSEDRVYKYRMHCPYCGIVSECRCFETLEEVEDFIEREISVECSIVCAPIINYIHKHGGICIKI